MPQTPIRSRDEAANPAAVKSVLVFRMGSLGDTLVALPSMWAVRRAFPGARTTLLSDHQVGRNWVLARDLLEGAGVIDAYMNYPVEAGSGGRLLKSARMMRLLLTLRRRRFDALAYLAPSDRAASAIVRDRWFFRTAGIPHLLGMTGFPVFPAPDAPHPLPTMTHEADLLLARLRASGIAVPAAGRATMDLNLGDAERGRVETWLGQLHSDGGRPWIGVGPGTKMPSKRWPEERFREVVGRLIEQFDVWPVIFGGREDRDVGESLTAAWGRGYIDAGELPLRASASALSRCVLHVGNDTGTLHMAAAVGVPCVGVYAARNLPGHWHPYGEGHRVHRISIECENCNLYECIDRRMECILSIAASSVTESCAAVLSKRLSRTH